MATGQAGSGKHGNRSTSGRPPGPLRLCAEGGSPLPRSPLPRASLSLPSVSLSLCWPDSSGPLFHHNLSVELGRSLDLCFCHVRESPCRCHKDSRTCPIDRAMSSRAVSQGLPHSALSCSAGRWPCTELAKRTCHGAPQGVARCQSMVWLSPWRAIRVRGVNFAPACKRRCRRLKRPDQC